MLRWRYAAGNAAIGTKVGDRIGDHIRIRARYGAALTGPRVEMPAGRGTARIRFAGTPRGSGRMEVTADGGRRVIAAAPVNLSRIGAEGAELPFVLAEPVQDLEVRLFCRLGMVAEIEAVEIDLDRDLPAAPLDPDRPVGYESRKTYADKIAGGFFDRYLSGPNIMEVGYKGYEGGTVPIVPQAIGVDIGYAGYDGTSFPFADESFDAIYSSHCFEHIGPWKEVLQDWYRILRPGGFLIIVVPHQHLFERKRYRPSYFNADHKRFYTPQSLVAELEEAFDENSYRIRHLVENDKDFDYGPPPGQGSTGCYEIELVVEKIRKPYWALDDGSVRTYTAGEFRSAPMPSDPWSIALDCTAPYACIVYGPYIDLAAAPFVAEFHFEPMTVPDDAPLPDLLLDVAANANAIASHALKGDDLRAALQAGKVAIPFVNVEAGANFEFRIWTGKKTAALRPVFKGVVLAYDRP